MHQKPAPKFTDVGGTSRNAGVHSNMGAIESTINTNSGQKENKQNIGSIAPSTGGKKVSKTY